MLGHHFAPNVLRVAKQERLVYRTNCALSDPIEEMFVDTPEVIDFRCLLADDGKIACLRRIVRDCISEKPSPSGLFSRRTQARIVANGLLTRIHHS